MFTPVAEGESRYGIERVAARRMIFNVTVVACDEDGLPREVRGFERGSDKSGQQKHVLARHPVGARAVSLVAYAVGDEVFVKREIMTGRQSRQIRARLFRLALVHRSEER